ncbi:hypothetical protein KIN20_022207 [Parelaphostrongylus tenuis]|uniref:Uncharacterized protein n=1 Tax=Parelaphostrongylus tenuis TaxID=148309 RepID=A0AAD5MV56_PARTN|nr:hypothetical protein KIN20_022207 [Parelaphostrongylus tenuis]
MEGEKFGDKIDYTYYPPFWYGLANTVLRNIVSGVKRRCCHRNSAAREFSKMDVVPNYVLHISLRHRTTPNTCVQRRVVDAGMGNAIFIEHSKVLQRKIKKDHFSFRSFNNSCLHCATMDFVVPPKIQSEAFFMEL